MQRLFQILFGLLLACTPQMVFADAGTEFDKKYAVIFQYTAIDDEGDGKTAVTPEQFSAHIKELLSEKYTILPLPDIITAFQKQTELPPKTIAMTFDGNDASIVKIAAPVLIENKIPFTVFIAPADIKDAKNAMNWDSLRLLKATKLVSFGLHPDRHQRLMNEPDETIKRHINNALSDIRENLDITPTLFAYPFGEYNARYVRLVSQSGFAAGFGLQSGVAHGGANIYTLPRFPMIEALADLDRFTMAANAMPLPVIESVDDTTVLNTAIGFTLLDDIAPHVKNLKCFTARSDKIETHVMDARVELRIKEFSGDDIRINCIIPVDGDDDVVRWRWYGILFNLPVME